LYIVDRTTVTLSLVHLPICFFVGRRIGQDKKTVALHYGFNQFYFVVSIYFKLVLF